MIPGTDIKQGPKRAKITFDHSKVICVYISTIFFILSLEIGQNTNEGARQIDLANEGQIMLTLEDP